MASIQILIFISVFAFLCPVVILDYLDIIYPMFPFTYTQYPGVCPTNVTPYYATTNQTMYNGRWYIVYMGVKESVSKLLSCGTTDMFMDQPGNATVFYNYFPISIYTSIKSVWQPYGDTVGIFHQRHNIYEFLSTFFYVDEELYILQYMLCPDGKDYHYRNVVVMLRNVSSLSKKQTQINSMIEALKEKGVYTPIFPMNFENCVYKEAKNETFSTLINSKIVTCLLDLPTCFGY